MNTSCFSNFPEIKSGRNVILKFLNVMEKNIQCDRENKSDMR